MRLLNSALLLTLGLSLLAAPASAEKMDIATHGLVIEKLERVLPQMKKQEKRLPVILRLGDLYAERARLLSVKEIEKKCDGCMDSKKDRLKAIDLYQKAFEDADKSQQTKVLLQLGHLYQVTGQTPRAIRLFRNVIQSGSRYSKTLVAEAYAGLGEIYFNQGRFKSAAANFQRALGYSKIKNPGFITYRLAWCQLNLGQQRRATRTLESILRDPELLTINSTHGKTFDASFHQDVARDLATFYARGTVTSLEINKLVNYSPNESRKSILYYLGEETERVGNKVSALLVWDAFLNEGEPTDIERLEVQIRVTQIQFDLGRPSRAIDEMTVAVDQWKKNGCRDEDKCKFLKKRLRKFVLDWNRGQKRKPTEQLFHAYRLYGSLFQDDVEMHYWAAGVASALKRYEDALSFYHKSSLLAAQQVKRAKGKKQKSLSEIFEGSLLGEIEMAEATKSLDLRASAYDHYISMNPTGPNHINVRYQRAHVDYERKQYKSAAERFKAVALINSPSHAELRTKAADLALDALAILKDDPSLETWGRELAGHFPKRQNEYLRISRKASLNLVAKTLNDSKSDRGDWSRELKRLHAVNMSGANKDEQLSYYRNRLMLAEKLKDLKEIETSAKLLLAVNGLPEKDREYALSMQVWVAELQLDFDRAFKISKQMASGKAHDEALLRLAMLAELAGKNPNPYYYEFIKNTRSRHKANLVRAKLVRRSKYAWATLKTYLPQLAHSPEILSALALETFARFRNYTGANQVLAYKAVRETSSGQSLQRFVFMKDYKRLDRKIARHKIRTSSEVLMQKGLEKRIQLLAETDQFAQQALNTGDWTLQLLALSTVSRENERIYKELLALPVPRQLNQQQRQQYQAALSQQAEPYKQKSLEVRKKLEELWDDSNSVKTLVNEYLASHNEMRQLLGEELTALSEVAPRSPNRKFRRALAKRDARPSRRDIISARRAVQKDPFNVRRISYLKELEEVSGSGTMVAYLDARISRLKEGGQ